MSRESALAFIQKTSSDPALQGRIAGLAPNDAAGLVQIAASAGFLLSVEDLKEILSGAKSEQELGDGALERVSGGLKPTPAPPSPIPLPYPIENLRMFRALLGL